MTSELGHRFKVCCVRSDWVDDSGHMNNAYFGIPMELAAHELFKAIGCGKHYRETTKCAFFVRETHMVFCKEAGVGDSLLAASQILDLGGKWMLCFYQLFRGGDQALLATQEVLYVHVDLNLRQPRQIGKKMEDRLRKLSCRNYEHGIPEFSGRIEIRKQAPSTG